MTHMNSEKSQYFVKELQDTIKTWSKNVSVHSQRVSSSSLARRPRTIRIDASLIPKLSRFLVRQGGISGLVKDPNIHSQIEYNKAKVTLYYSGAIVSASFDIFEQPLKSFLQTNQQFEEGIMIGQDEAGKGEWFGPMTVGSVALSADSAIDLRLLGVTDSKFLESESIDALFGEIKKRVLALRVVEISPHKFNELYARFGDEGKTLNDLLAWGHKKALEETLAQLEKKGMRLDEIKVIIDEFDRLKTEKRLSWLIREHNITLVQKHRADQAVLAVAAASIVAKAVQQMVVRDFEAKLDMQVSQIDPIQFISSPDVLQYAKLSFLQKLVRTKMSKRPAPKPPFLIGTDLTEVQTEKKLEEIARGGENIVVEFKESLPKNASDISKELTAFANTFGGVLLVGVNDNGQLCGTQNPAKDQERIAGIASRKCDPPISPRFRTVSYHSHKILIVEIEQSLWAHQSDGKYYLRYGNTCQSAPHSLVEQLLEEKKALRTKR